MQNPSSRRLSLCCLGLLTFCFALPAQDRPIRVPLDPQLSPRGDVIVFAWQNDIWLAQNAGGQARRLTYHPAGDSQPRISPDGQSLAFLSKRSGLSQVHVMPIEGGTARQVTHDSGRKTLLGFAPDGKSLIIQQDVDRFPSRGENSRAFLVSLERREAPRMLFDAGCRQLTLSPDGKAALFTREGTSWWRKGYQGSQAAQIWHADLRMDPPRLSRMSRDKPHFQNIAESSPLWAADGEGYYFVSDPNGVANVYYRRLDGSGQRQITKLEERDGSDDGAAYASLSADGRTMLFRRRFDLLRLDVPSHKIEQLSLQASGEALASAIERRVEKSATAVAFTKDGKQIAMVAGNDVWVMDTVLKEPVRLTSTTERESDLQFSADGKSLYFVSSAEGEVDIWRAKLSDKEGIWWKEQDFALARVTNDKEVEANLSLSPTGLHMAYTKDNHLFVMDMEKPEPEPKAKSEKDKEAAAKKTEIQHRHLVGSWNAPSFDWSPDGKWITYSMQDDDFNSEVFVLPLDGSRPPFNISRHPDNDSNPKWSPDGKRIAFVGRRALQESDIYYVNLQKEAEEETERDRRLKEAMETMKKKGKKKASGKGPGSGRGRGRGRGRRPGGGRGGQPPQEPGEKKKPEDEKQDKDKEDKKEKEEPVKVTIHFEGIHERIHRISIPDSTERSLLWSPDGEKLAFSASVDGANGFYTVTFPDKLRQPEKLADSALRSARWLKQSDEIVGLGRSRSSSRGSGAPPNMPPNIPPRYRSRYRGRRGGGGVPAAMNSRGSVTTYGFSVHVLRDWRSLREAAFDEGWRAMRDRFYDGNMNNRDWNAIRTKYRTIAAACLGKREFSELMNMMLGELNASHMGHRGGSDPLPKPPSNEEGWTPRTHKLGLRFDRSAKTKGLAVASVIPGSPCDLARSKVEVGEILMAVDGHPVDSSTDLAQHLNLPTARDIELTIQGGDGKERKVKVWPVTSYGSLLYKEWVEGNRKQVGKLSGGSLGYLHIQGMNMSSFQRLEEDLHHAGYGKSGLIIDVRYNGGGSTTDHVLTVLTQPKHAITIPRGGGKGYPQDRKVYASWTKPIVLMCNQNSFSNAEILSHAIKGLGRGQIVGMRTAGGVISTGGARLIDGSSVRMPFRGWYISGTGQDMELNGCEPDICIWNEPYGPDAQLEAAVQALSGDVARIKASKEVKVMPASMREGRWRK